MYGILRRTRALAVGLAAVIAATVLLAPTASADHLNSSLSIEVGSPLKLVNGVYLIVPVTVTCPDPELGPTQFIQSESVSVTVTQRAGRSLATGSGGIFYSDDRAFGGGIFGTPLTCDGTPHTYSVNVFPMTGVPFKGGRAVAAASFNIFVQDTSTFRGDNNFSSSGPTSVQIRG
jgi:hypothetical protein